MYSRSDRLSIRTLSQQTFPDCPRLLQKAMSWVEKNVSGHLKYVLLDVGPTSHLPPNMVVRTLIFPQNGVLSPVYFIPANTED